jgi:hypothetical protein
MSSDGKVRVLVKSRKVPARTVDLSETLYTPSGIPIGKRTNRLLLYDYVLDEDHRRTIQEAHELARRLCLDLEVVDSARQGVFRRLLSTLGHRGSSNPIIEVSPSSSMTHPVRSPIPIQARQ